jgi:hypothetical protein
MSPVTSVIFPPTIDAVLAKIGTLSDSAYAVLRQEIEGDSAFDVNSERCERLSPTLELAPDQVGLVFAAVEFLYDRMKDLPKGTQPAETLRRVVDSFDELKLGADIREKLLNRLGELIAPNEKAELAQKIRRLRTGFLDNATAFSTFVDLRPDFTPGYETVRALVPVIQLMVSTDAEDAARQHVVFQLDERGLTGLKTVVEYAERKLNTLKAKGVENLKIIFEEKVR